MENALPSVEGRQEDGYCLGPVLVSRDDTRYGGALWWIHDLRARIFDGVLAIGNGEFGIRCVAFGFLQWGLGCRSRLGSNGGIQGAHFDLYISSSATKQAVLDSMPVSGIKSKGREEGDIHCNASCMHTNALLHFYWDIEDIDCQVYNLRYAHHEAKLMLQVYDTSQSLLELYLSGLISNL